MIDTWIAVVGGLVATALGAGLARWIQRARPTVIPTSIRMSSDVIPDGSVVEPNSDLLAQCSEHPYIEPVPFVGIGKVKEREYVDYLSRALETAQTYVRVRLPALAERAQQLQTKLAADDFDGVAQIWSREWFELWNIVESSYVRQEFDLEPEPMDDAASEARAGGQPTQGWFLVDKGDGIVYAIQGRPPYTALAFQAQSRLGPLGKASSEVAKRLGHAIVYQKKQDLTRVVNFLATMERKIPALESLSQRIEAELRRLNRLSVTALISNTGGSPVSLSTPRAQMTMFLAGYSYKVAGDAEPRPHVRSEPLEVSMTLVDERGHPIPPLAVEPGGVRPVTGVITTPLSEERLPEGGTLHDLVRSALDGSERSWRLALEVVLPSRPAAKIHSNKVRFRELQDSEVGVTLSDDREKEITELQNRIRSQENELSSARAELSLAREYLYAAQESSNGNAAMLREGSGEPHGVETGSQEHAMPYGPGEQVMEGPGPRSRANPSASSLRPEGTSTE